MGWTTSLHVRTRDMEKVIASLGVLNQRECFVGFSGENSVGVWSQKQERSAGHQTLQLVETGGRSLVAGAAHDGKEINDER